MEMRKFIVEIHPDGTVHATEYEDREENPAEKIIKAVEQRKEKQQNIAWRAAECGDMESYRVNQTAALEDRMILQLIKHAVRRR